MSLLLAGMVPVLAMPVALLVIILALWALYPRADDLLLKGRASSAEGRPAQAEQYFRKGLARGERLPPEMRVRLLLNLGMALTDQDRRTEAEHCLERALTLGDATGNVTGALAKLLLLQGTPSLRALSLVDTAMEVQGRYWKSRVYPFDWRNRFANVNLAILYAQKAWAQTLLGRQDDARTSIEAAGDSLAAALAGTPNYPRNSTYGPDYRTLLQVGAAEAHWTMGMALLAMQESAEAAGHFQTACETAPKSTFGRLAQQRIEQAGAAAA